ncbi:hypothetical protein BK769_09725 [Bacillus thuringiensis serovar kumamtoensis]|uniref:Uncharacterized protein n=2 Tax=Bacillus TaxID=1386 RepID=A0A9X6JRV8_BACUK|nr:hypothetical protein BK769_09725 [Bacillus thuringiensis serovar kumamtoensis]
MMPNSSSISKFQLFFLLIQSQIGIGLLSLPNVVQSTAKGDGWISTIIAGGAIQLTLIIYWLLLRRFPNQMYTEITKKILGNLLGKLCNTAIYLYYILMGSLSAVLFIQCINVWLLPLTPLWVLSLTIMVASVYLTLGGLRIIARFFVLASFLILFLIFLSFLTFNLPKEFQFILPMGDSGIENILLGSKNTLFSMAGFDGILLISPFILNREKGVLKTISLSNLSITTLYTYFLFLCLVSISPSQLMQIKEPVLYLFRALSYQMTDRLDFLFLSIWIVPMTTSVIINLFLSAKSISKEKVYKKNVVFSGILIYIISIIPFNEKMIDLFSKYVSYLSYGIVFGLPVFLLCLSIIFNKMERKENT